MVFSVVVQTPFVLLLFSRLFPLLQKLTVDTDWDASDTAARQRARVEPRLASSCHVFFLEVKDSMPFSPNRSIVRRRSEKNKDFQKEKSFPSPLFNLRRKKKLETMRRSRSRSPVRDSRGRDRDRDRDRDRGDYGGGSGSGYGYSRGGGGGGGYENNDRRGGGREQGAPKVGLCSPWTCFEASRQAQA